MKWKWVLYSIFFLIIVWGFFSLGKLTIIQYWGKKVTAAVIETPSQCDKYNYIKVLHDSSEYEVSIGRSDCTGGVYQIGQKVELLKYKNYNELVWPESDFRLVTIITLVGLLFGAFTIRKKYRK